jgi:hypothetical protein
MIAALRLPVCKECAAKLAAMEGGAVLRSEQGAAVDA